ncbi:unnamed protein product [Dracunculus medinensis]|uniref:ADF-H domain-containing protein n=1 Tax=Dracunculus medinensis TaxID=318479 RepID=A0A0N4UPE9_DRAME|nr:unnamed protein product [Dracunculus medinensis]
MKVVANHYYIRIRQSLNRAAEFLSDLAMSTSGISVNPEVPVVFLQLSEGKKFRYICFRIDDSEILVDTAVADDELNLTVEDYVNDSKEAFEVFIQDLKKRTNSLTDCRYAVFDFKFMITRLGAGSSKMDKILFFQLCPDGATVKKKMIYASSAAVIKSALGSEKFISFQASGVKIDASCKKAYDDLHNKHLHSYIIFRISDDDTTIIVDKIGDKGAPYSAFVEELRKSVGDGKECRYAAVDVEVQVQRQGTDGSSRLTKVVFVHCPDDAPVRRRMLYASSVRALKATLGLESLMQVQASDLSDIDEKAIKHELMSHQRT